MVCYHHLCCVTYAHEGIVSWVLKTSGAMLKSLEFGGIFGGFKLNWSGRGHVKPHRLDSLI